MEFGTGPGEVCCGKDCLFYNNNFIAVGGGLQFSRNGCSKKQVCAYESKPLPNWKCQDCRLNEVNLDDEVCSRDRRAQATGRCNACKAGYFYEKKSDKCMECAEGSYSYEHIIVPGDRCNVCKAGYFYKKKSDKCVKCAEGKSS